MIRARLACTLLLAGLWPGGLSAEAPTVAEAPMAKEAKGKAAPSTATTAAEGKKPRSLAELPDPFFDALAYRYIGPVGNRVPAVVGAPGDPNVYYAGSASGGIFKTTDGGAHWQPIFDDQPAASIGSLAVSLSDPNVVWAGTGETFIRSNISIGDGIYRSLDAGKTWKNVGLEKTGRIGRVVIHPTNPDVVYAAALGHCYGPQQERGVYRTQDGGASWERVLFAGEEAGAIDLVMDPNNPRILFAATWQFHMNTWSRTSGGPGSGLWTSRDGGDSWTRLEGNGLPEPPWGKIGLTMSADDSDRVYALIETSSNRDFAPVDEFQGVLWRSDDGGESWKMINRDNNLAQRPLYYTRMVAQPDDRDEVHFMAVVQSRSLDGGVSSEVNNSGWDHHDLWIDPLLPDRMIAGHDGGVSISTNRGKSWSRPLLPIAQMYHVEVDDRVPYFVYGNRQDGPSTRGPSNSLTGATIPIGAWHSVGGCEVGFTVPTPTKGASGGDGDIVWTGCYDGILERYNLATGHGRNVSVWPVAVESWPSIDLEYRFQWTFPLALSPHDPETVYAGSQYVHRTTNGGQSWDRISPDLTTNDPALQVRSGGLTLDDAGPSIAPVVFAIAESPIERGVIWAGTNDGLVQVSRDGGESWTDVTAGLQGLPKHGTVSNVEPSRHQPGTCYLTVDRHQLGDSEPYVYKTENYGVSWRRIDSAVPRSVFSYAHCVREDPVREGLLYLGTENALYVSFDDGRAWRSLQSNLPRVPVHWLTVQEHFNDLVVATYGRGFWVLDDLTPLQRLDLETANEPAALLAPRPAYRFLPKGAPMEQPEDPAAGRNPEYGASIHYLLAEPEGEADEKATKATEATKAAKAEEGEEEKESAASIEIVNAAGEVVRTLEEVAAGPGLHRVHWDLLFDETPQVKLRTAPVENSKLPLGEENWRELSDGGRFTVFAPPGRYTVRLKVGDASHEQPLEVLQDPSSEATAEDLAEQTRVILELRARIERAAGIINDSEWVRRQIDQLEERLAGNEAAEGALATAKELDERFLAIESEFFDPRLTGAGQDTLRWKRLLYSRLLYLGWGLQGADFRPTDQQMEVHAMLGEQLATVEQRFEAATSEGLTKLNAQLAEAGLAGVIVPVAEKE